MSSPVTFVLVAVPPNLRHALTRWMIEPAAGVFVGTLNTRVRNELWQQIQLATEEGWAVMVHTAQTEQGFLIETTGYDRRTIDDWDGIQLVTTGPQHLENPDDLF